MSICTLNCVRCTVSVCYSERLLIEGEKHAQLYIIIQGDVDIVDLDAASAVAGPIDAGKDEPDTLPPQPEMKKPDPIVVSSAKIVASPAKKSGSKKGKKEKEKKEKSKGKEKGEAWITMDCHSHACYNASMQ